MAHDISRSWIKCDCRNLAQLLSHLNMKSGLIYKRRLIWCLMQIKLCGIWQVQRHEMQVQIANSYRMTAKKEHQRILQRRQIIEDRKEQLEHLNDQRVCPTPTHTHMHIEPVKDITNETTMMTFPLSLHSYKCSSSLKLASVFPLKRLYTLFNTSSHLIHMLL